VGSSDHFATLGSAKYNIQTKAAIAYRNLTLLPCRGQSDFTPVLSKHGAAAQKRAGHDL